MSKLYRLYDDEYTVGFCSVEAEGIPHGDQFRRLEFKGGVGGGGGDFIVAAGVVQQGERLYRLRIRRKLKKGTRNITNIIGQSAVLLGWAMEPKRMASDKPEGVKAVVKEMERKLDGVLTGIREELQVCDRLSFPFSYVVDEDVMEKARETGCADYFADIEGQRILSHRFDIIADAIRKKYPDAAKKVLGALISTQNQDHLSMISLESGKEGGLFVTFVDPDGHHLKVEAKRVVEMVRGSGETKRLFVFPKQGDRTVIESSFNDRKEGEVYGKITMNPMVLEVACCTGTGGVRNVVDKAIFYLDPEYLLCLWSVLKRIDADEQRYRQLKAQAEMHTEFDPFFIGIS